MHKCTYVRIKKRPRENAAVVRREVYSYEEERVSEESGAWCNLRHSKGVEAKAKHGEGWTQLGVPLQTPLLKVKLRTKYRRISPFIS